MALGYHQCQGHEGGVGATMEGGIFLYTKQIASSELLLEALDGFNGIFVGGVDRSRNVPGPLLSYSFVLGRLLLVLI